MTAPTRQLYLTALTDDQWNILPPRIPPAKPGGRPRVPHVLRHLALATSLRLAVIWAESKYHNHGLNEWIAIESPGNCRLEVAKISHIYRH